MKRQALNISSRKRCGSFIGIILQLIPVRTELFVGVLLYRNTKVLVTVRVCIFKRLQSGYERDSLPNKGRVKHSEVNLIPHLYFVSKEKAYQAITNARTFNF